MVKCGHAAANSRVCLYNCLGQLLISVKPPSFSSLSRLYPVALLCSFSTLCSLKFLSQFLLHSTCAGGELHPTKSDVCHLNGVQMIGSVRAMSRCVETWFGWSKGTSFGRKRGLMAAYHKKTIF